MGFIAALLVVLATLTSQISAQSSCSTSLAPSGNIKPSLASGYRAQVVATGFSNPRGLKFDNAGNLLVIEAGSGSLTAISLNHNGGCVSVGSTTNLVSSQNLNHGIELSGDGKTLYASSSESVFSWEYDASSRSVTNMQTLVTNMAGSDHTTRTLLLSKKAPSHLVVTRGSTANLDFQASELSSGHSQIKAFNLSSHTGSPLDFDSNGLRLGWGLRNDVGIAEHPTSGGIYSVENSGDQISRMGVDVHNNNPGEELNFLGYLNGQTSTNQGKNFGYPWCFAAWGVSELPGNAKLRVGSQFAVDASSDLNNENKTDAYCAEQVAPRLTFQAHMAPIDIKFHNGGTEAWISFHGSWDRTDPVGYKVSVVSFANGEPVDGPHSTRAATDIFFNADNSVCPDDCFRPTGLAFDGQGRLFVASDASGEIYMITKEGSNSITKPSGTSTSASSGSIASATSSAMSSASSAASAGAASSWRPFCWLYGVATLLWSLVLMLV